MSKIKVEAFLPIPLCVGGTYLSELLKEIEVEYRDRIDVIVHQGRYEQAVIVGGSIRIEEGRPSKETLVAALKQAGLRQSKKGI